MASDQPVYALGHDEHELRRLEDQARIMADLTDHALRRGGLASGMSVLDIGTGIGDVAIIAANIVGPHGRVLGIDRAPDAIAVAERRARAAAVTNVSFAVADFTDPPTERYDAVVGRLVLLHTPDPLGALRGLLRCLPPGGLMILSELIISAARAYYPAPVRNRALHIMKEAFVRAGIALDAGTALPGQLREIGLVERGAVVGQAVSPPGEGFPSLLTGVVRSIMPIAVQHGIATAQEIGIDTLEDRLRKEAAAHPNAIALYSAMMTAWGKVPDLTG